MEKTNYPKNRRKANYGSMNCFECGCSMEKKINNLKFCSECRIKVTMRMSKENHKRRYLDKEYREHMLNYNKEWRKENRDKLAAHDKKAKELNPEKVKARNLSRTIPKASCCGICKSTERLEKHHWRYDKPLLFSTLCKTCHTIQHVKNFKQSIYAKPQGARIW